MKDWCLRVRVIDENQIHVDRRVVLVETLSPEPLEVIKPFRVDLEPSESEGFRASFTEANLMAFGETEPEALANLKDILVATFEALSAAGNVQRLAPVTARQLAVLRHFVRLPD